MRVLVTGAAGYIGFEVVQALRRKGHTVYGLVRKESDAQRLVLNEIIPVIGDLQQLVDGKDNAIGPALDKVSVVIDMVMAPDLSTGPNRALMQAFLKRSKEDFATSSTRRRYIYCSGIMVYGDYKGLVDENMPCKVSAMPRVAFEKELLALNGNDFETVVVRPPHIYGGVGNKYTQRHWFGNAKGEIEVVGNPNKRYGWVHYLDNAEAFVLVAGAAGAIVGGQIFDVADDTRITAEDLAVLLARSNGVKGPVVHLPAGDDPFSKIVDANVVPRADKIRRQLGWTPHFGTLQDNVQQWHAAMKASGKLDSKAGVM